MTRHTDLAILANSEIFRQLSDEALEDIRSRCFRKRLAKGEVIIRQDDPVTSFFIVVVGRLKVSQMTPEGQQVIIRYLGAGELVGYSAFAGTETYPGTVTAVEDTHLMGWSVSFLPALIEKHPPILSNALAVIGTRYRELQERLREHSTEKVERRIAHTILRLASTAGRRTTQGVEIAFPLSRQDLAEMAGTTLHTVSRTMSGWEDLGIVSSGRRRVVVCRPEELATVSLGAG